MAHTPFSLILFFLLTTLVALFLLVKATNNSRLVLVLSIAWLGLQSVISLKGFYTVSNGFPPRFFLVIGPPLLTILVLLLTGSGKRFLAGINLKWATLLHSVRMLVEITLYFLVVYKQASVLVSIEGGNIDFFAGLTAPIIWWAYSKRRIGRKGLLAWNIISLVSLGNAVVRSHPVCALSLSAVRFRPTDCSHSLFSLCLTPCVYRSLCFVVSCGGYAEI